MGEDSDPARSLGDVDAEDDHAFRPPGDYDYRGPCPALNTLANHGYLPRDGCNISAQDFMDALQSTNTYNISGQLAIVLACGGLFMLHKLPPGTHITLHDLAKHGRIEHNASIVHKDTATGNKYAPTRCDTVLLNNFLEDKEFLTLDDIAKHRVELENVSKLDPVHQEIARGEWALVSDIFGRAHEGKIPTEPLRIWLKENRFPEGWKPTHQQGLWATTTKSWAIRTRMDKLRKESESSSEAAEALFLDKTLKTEPGDGRRMESPAPSSRPTKRQKTID